MAAYGDQPAIGQKPLSTAVDFVRVLAVGINLRDVHELGIGIAQRSVHIPDVGRRVIRYVTVAVRIGQVLVSVPPEQNLSVRQQAHVDRYDRHGDRLRPLPGLRRLLGGESDGVAGER